MIADAAEMLEAHPLLGVPAQKPGTRELPVPDTTYTLVYRVTSRVILKKQLNRGGRKGIQVFIALSALI